MTRQTARLTGTLRQSVVSRNTLHRRVIAYAAGWLPLWFLLSIVWNSLASSLERRLPASGNKISGQKTRSYDSTRGDAEDGPRRRLGRCVRPSSVLLTRRPNDERFLPAIAGSITVTSVRFSLLLLTAQQVAGALTAHVNGAVDKV